jgi:serine/threonine-protein kinase
MIGQVVLGRYKIVRPLDEGGMSKIYLARQLDLNRDVVVKVLKEQHLAQPKTREHFRREIYIMSRFRHPNAVAYYDSGVKETGGPVLVMEYLRGVDLHTVLQREGRLAPDRVGRLLAQLCDVLQAAHDAGIVHRDVKPGNLMVLNAGTPQETVKLMDFGLAKMSSLLYISPDDLVDFSLPAAAGTPEYISPEQVRGSDMDGRGDLYSVGVILFELLTGRRPFSHANVDDLLRAHGNEEAPTFAAVGAPGVPRAIEDVVRRCLEKFPDHRPKRATELAQLYEHALGRRINVVRRTPPPPTVPPTASAGKSDSAPGVPPRPVLGAAGKAGSAPGSLLRPASVAVSPSAPPPGSGFVRHSVEVVMPEAMAMVKLKGFIYDLGGEVIESVPGMIKVRVPESKAANAGTGLLGWIKGDRPPPPPATEIEMHMERRDPSEPGKLTITLVMRPGTRMVSTEWHLRCKKIGMDLQAYLMGRWPSGNGSLSFWTSAEQ